jgi:hypothetical protein
MTMRRIRSLGLTLGLVGLLLPASAQATAVLFSASGVDTSAIQPTVDAFRAALGDPNNGNAPGPLASGRREINWDGGGAVTPTVSGTPFAGFQNTRGALMTTPGTGFIQGAPDALATQFGNATYGTAFAAFSALRLFTPIESNLTDVTFSIPGSGGATAATVSAFGAVFSDVDTNATTMEFFSPEDVSLGAYTVPNTPGSATFSFLGLAFDAGEQIARVRIVTGNTALGPNDVVDGSDVVVMDDFLYAEPVPEPGAFALIALGLASLGVRQRRRADARGAVARGCRSRRA